MLHVNENTLTHIVNYEKKTFDKKKKNWKVRHDARQYIRNPQIS